MTITFDIVQNEDRSGAGGQAGNGSFKVNRRCRLTSPRGSVKWSYVVESVSVKIRSALLSAEMSQNGVDGHPMNPGRERGLCPERAQGAPRPDEGLLGQVLGVRRSCRQAKAEGVDSAAMGVIQGFKSVPISSLGPANEQSIINHGMINSAIAGSVLLVNLHRVHH